MKRPTTRKLTGKHIAPEDSLAGIFEHSQNNETPRPISARSQQIKDTKLQARINFKLDQMFPSKANQPSPSSADDVRDAFRASTVANREGLRPGSIAGGMLMPNETSSSSAQRQVAAHILADSAIVAHRNKRTVRSRPSLGRTVEVEPALGTDLGTAMRKLTVLTNSNRVLYDSRKGKFHERAGAKRKRLKSERWRKYFMTAFQATVQRVKKMRRQGW